MSVRCYFCGAWVEATSVEPTTMHKSASVEGEVAACFVPCCRLCHDAEMHVAS